MKILRRAANLVRYGSQPLIDYIRSQRVRRSTRNTSVLIVSDGEEWILDSIADNIVRGLKNKVAIDKLVFRDAVFAQNKVLHLISNWYLFNAKGKLVPYDESNRIIAIWSWGNEQGGSYDPHAQMALQHLPRLSERAALIQTQNSIAQQLLLDIGIPEEKVVLIPQGIDLQLFRPLPSPHVKQQMRERLGIPDDHVCIGIFQKDGSGWGDGNEPKFPKGPDVLIKALAQLAEQVPVVALLPGPARGFVKEGLRAHGVTYVGSKRLTQRELVPWYYASDIYLIPSREEGGPAGLLEAMATGTAVVSTRCGMAPDLIRHGENGFLVDVEDADGLAYYARVLLQDRQCNTNFVQEALKTIQPYAWETLVESYITSLYRPLLMH